MNMPLRVSLVPPDLEMMMQSVLFKSLPIVAKTRSIPSGSVLSKKYGFSLSVRGSPKAWATNCGPKRGTANPD